MFSFDPHFDAPLLADHADLPVFDEVVMYTLSPFSTSSSLSTSPSVQSDPLPPVFSQVDLASMPIPPMRPSTRNKNPNHIPRPRNAFMLFRSAFAAAQKVTSKIEHDNRHITRIIAHCWNRLSHVDKQIWREKAAAEKALHKERYPNYRFSPVCRARRPKKRQVRRNGDKDVKRCAKVADLVMAGKCGDDLERAMNEIDKESDSDAELDVVAGEEKPTSLLVLDGPDIVAPFRSPLLPPVQPLVNAAAPASNDLGSLLSYQYYQPSASPSPPAHYQSIAAFVQGHPGNPVQPEQSASEYFSWNQSNNFSYYH